MSGFTLEHLNAGAPAINMIFGKVTISAEEKTALDVGVRGEWIVTKHTPGPWAPYDRVDGNVTVLGGIGGDDLVLRTEEWSDNEADMYLIAVGA